MNSFSTETPSINFSKKNLSSLSNLLKATESYLDLRQDIALKKDLSPLKKMLKDRLDEGFSVFVTAHNKAQAERFASLLEDFRIINVSGQSVIENIKSTETPAIQVCEGAVSTGFRLPSEKLILLAVEEIVR